MIQDRDKPKVQERLAGMTEPVTAVLFTRKTDCEYCTETREILEDLAELNDRIRVEVHDIDDEPEVAASYNVDKAPAIALVGARDHGIRYYGIPAGYEFASLLEDLVMVSTGDTGLGEATREILKSLRTPVHLQVFVTPTCPYCPPAVRLAHKFAMESDLVTADMVEATEFPELATRMGVSGVPKTVANGVGAVEGALPEEEFLERILEATTG